MSRKVLFRATLAVLVLVAPLFAQVSLLTPGKLNSPEELKGKVLLIRGFYGGAKLHFDERGGLLQGGKPESWTLAGVQITDVRPYRDHVEITGTRVALLYDMKTKQFGTIERQVFTHGRERKLDKVTIKVDISSPSDAAVMRAAQDIFLSSADHLVDLVPEYWRDVVRESTGTAAQPATAADATAATPVVTAAEQPSTPPVVPEAPTSADVGRPVAADLPKNVLKVGSGVTAPKVISSPDPNYDDPARVAMIQGTTVLWLIVDAKGSVRNVRIARPLGFGLDDEAVKAVETWRFHPATKDGAPVAVQVNVEVNFRLY